MPMAPKKGAGSKTGRSRRRGDAAKLRVDWMLREARCVAEPGAEVKTPELLLQEEIEWMRSIGKSAEAIAAFEQAAAVYLGSAMEPFRASGSKGNLCRDCQALIESSAFDRHASLEIYHVRVVPEGDIDYYKCHACGSQLLHEHKRNAPSKVWRLL